MEIAGKNVLIMQDQKGGNKDPRWIRIGEKLEVADEILDHNRMGEEAVVSSEQDNPDDYQLVQQ